MCVFHRLSSVPSTFNGELGHCFSIKYGSIFSEGENVALQWVYKWNLAFKMPYAIG
jgi:hypothetical protein